MTLFAIYVGGSHPRAAIEVHDVQFVAAESIERAWPILRTRWWGTPGSLHIDGYAVLDAVDGYDVTAVPREPRTADGPTLFFVNTGGYAANAFGELHRFSFHVAADKKAAWRAAKSAAGDFLQVHQDNLDPIDDIVAVDDALAPQNMTVRLTANAAHAGRAPTLVSRYIKAP